MIDFKNILYFLAIILIALILISLILYKILSNNETKNIILKNILAPLIVAITTFLLIGCIGNEIQIKNYEFNKNNAAISFKKKLNLEIKDNKLNIVGSYEQGKIKECMIVAFYNQYNKKDNKNMISYIPVSVNEYKGTVDAKIPLDKMATNNKDKNYYDTLQFGLIYKDMLDNKNSLYYVVLPSKEANTTIYNENTNTTYHDNNKSKVKKLYTDVLGMHTYTYDAKNLYNQFSDNIFSQKNTSYYNGMSITNYIPYYKPSIKELERNIEILANIKQDY